MARNEAVARLEAVLFLAREPIGSRKLAQLANLADGTETRTLVRKLNHCYDAEGCSFRVVEVAGGLQLRTRPRFAAWLRRLHSLPVEVRLSGPAMETLAVVAYRQPVLRAELEAIRGVQCGEILRQLMERDLVRVAGRSEELGRPFAYGTTKRFLEVFGLRHIEDLPRPELSRGSTPPGSLAAAAAGMESGSVEPSSSFNKSEEEPNVRTATDTLVNLDDAGPDQAGLILDGPGLEGDADRPVFAAFKDEEADEEFEDDEDLDDDEEDDDFDDEDDEDFEDDDDLDDEEDDDVEEDEDLEEEEWEEVDDDDEDLDEEEDEEEFDDDEDDDWDDEDEEEDAEEDDE